MSSRNTSTIETRLQHIAQDYEKRGYKVAISPSTKDLPRFLGRFRPDIVARGPGDSVIIEVKSPKKKRGVDYWQDLSRAVRSHPGWRIEFIVNGPPNKYDQENISDDLVEGRLEEGRRLAEAGMLTASLLITWSAAEAAMRLASARAEVDLPDLRPSTVITRLYTDGVLDREEYDFLAQCMRIRNAVGHGFRVKGINVSLLRRLEKLSARLLETYRS